MKDVDVVQRAKALLANKFTPEPWDILDAEGGSWGYEIWHDDGQPGLTIVASNITQGYDDGRGDAEFIAAAPTLVRELIEEVERLASQNRLLELSITEEVGHLTPAEKTELENLRCTT